MRISGWLLVNAFTGVFADPVGSSYATGDQGRDCGGGNAARAAASLPLGSGGRLAAASGYLLPDRRLGPEGRPV